MDVSKVGRSLRAAGLSGEVVDRDHLDFETARHVWNGLADRRPAAVVRAATIGDVMATVGFASEHELLLAVRGGGHSLPGLSTCDDGIVLDLRALNAIRIDPGGRIATVGGGALLGDVDRAGSAHDLVVPAGVISHTGVAGLTLGGGMGWLSRRFGLTIDNLVGVSMVLADGRLVDVDAQREPELFWGIRGGGGNFGVVVEFRFRMHELGSVTVGEWTFGIDDAAGILERYRELAAEAPRHVTTALSLMRSAINVTALSSGTSDGAAAVEPFGRIGRPTSAKVGPASFVEVQSKSDDFYAWGRRVYAKGGFLGAIDGPAVESMLGAVAAGPSEEAEIYVLQLGGAVADVDPDATAYVGRTAGHYWLVEPVWDDPADDGRNIAWGRATAGALADHSLAGNYVNEQADADPSVARSAYGQATYRRLAELKRAVDPANLFRLNQNVQPAAPGPGSEPATVAVPT